MKSLTIKFLASAIALVFVTGCGDDFVAPETPSGTTITAQLAANSEFDILEAALAKTGLGLTYDNNNSGQFTMFAPNDAAFLAYAQTTFSTPGMTEDEAIAKIGQLTNVSTPLSIGTLSSRLNYHVISSKLLSSQITGNQTFVTLNGARISVSAVGSDILVNANVGATSSKVVTKDTEASNGVIQTVDKVMAAATTNTTVLTPFGLAVSYATATPVITGGSETAGDAAGGDFDIVSYAIKKAGLVTTIIPNATPLPDYTIFAPTDNAFRAYLGDNAAASATLENAAIANLKAKSVEEVAELLKYHVLAGRYLSTDLANGKVLTTLLPSKTITVAVDGASVISLSDGNGAADPVVTATNNVHNNGVVHTVNAVLRAN